MGLRRRREKSKCAIAVEKVCQVIIAVMLFIASGKLCLYSSCSMLLRRTCQLIMVVIVLSRLSCDGPRGNVLSIVSSFVLHCFLKTHAYENVLLVIDVFASRST